MKISKSLPMIASLYINYLFQGIASIVISQNKTVFQASWGASLSQISLVISAIGLGRIFSLSFSGYFSDRVGRKPAVLLGTSSYILFYLGILLSPNYYVAFAVTLLAGVGNAFLDTATYPVVVELFPAESDSSSLSILNKAFISVGQFIFPIMVSFSLRQNIHFAWSILFCIVCLLLNLAYIWKIDFPQVSNRKFTSSSKSGQAKASAAPIKHSQAKVQLEGLSLIIFSFVSVSLFNIFIIWIPSYAEEILNLSEETSLVYVSLYSFCSFCSVFMTSMLVKRGINIPYLIFTCCLLTGLGLAYMVIWPSSLSLVVASVAVGLFSAGGIWQLGLLLLLEFFPGGGKGIITSYYSLATAVSIMVTPYLTGIMAEQSIVSVFIYNIFLSFLACLVLLVIIKRYRQVIKPQAESAVIDMIS